MHYAHLFKVADANICYMQRNLIGFKRLRSGKTIYLYQLRVNRNTQKLKFDICIFYIRFLYPFESLASDMSNKFAIYRLPTTYFQYTWLGFFCSLHFPKKMFASLCELLSCPNVKYFLLTLLTF